MQGTTAAKRREGKNAAGPISSISGKGEVIITETIKNKLFFRKILTKAENEEDVLSAIAIYLGDVRV